MRLALAIAASLLEACGGRFPHPPYSPQPTSALAPLRAPPPPARVENVPPRPAPGAVWIDGEWTWRRARWAWTPGRWVAAPPGETFSPWVVVRGDDGQLWAAPGTWRNAQGGAVEAPAPLAVAVVDSAPVVNASGVIEPTRRTRQTTPKTDGEAPPP